MAKRNLLLLSLSLLLTQSFGTGSFAADSLLQGGVKNELQLNPSLQLTPQLRGSTNQTTSPGASDAPVQYKGNVRLGPPLPAAAQTNVPELLGGSIRGASGGMQGIIVPISSYNRTPGGAGGVINYVPVNTAPDHYKTIGRGVTVLSPDLAVSAMPDLMPAVVSPGRFAGGTIGQFIQPQMIAPGLNTNATVSALPKSPPGYVTRRGVTAAPGYEVSIKLPGLSKETLGGRWSANQPLPLSLCAVPGTLQSQRIFTRLEPAGEVAHAGLLTQLQANRTCASWPDWYRVLARAIYSGWQTADVCPGTAKIEITVKANHDINGRVVDFVAADGMERNIPRETKFRETAVKIVDRTGYFEIPDFPDSETKLVVFDIDLKRTVDGPTGVSIVGMPDKK